MRELVHMHNNNKSKQSVHCIVHTRSCFDLELHVFYYIFIYIGKFCGILYVATLLRGCWCVKGFRRAFFCCANVNQRESCQRFLHVFANTLNLIQPDVILYAYTSLVMQPMDSSNAINYLIMYVTVINSLQYTSTGQNTCLVRG